MRRLATACALAFLLAACGPKSVTISVNVITRTCQPDLDPFDGVTAIEVRVSGDGIDPPLLTQADKGEGTVSIPEIPAGKHRVIEVRGLADKSTPRPISIGRSVPFEIPDVLTDTNRNVEINIYLRKVDTFTPPSPASAPGDCAQMRAARAGHTATLLPDGRVYIAGGFHLDAAKVNRIADDSTEFYNPDKGAFEDGPRVTVGSSGLARAFRTATLLPNGQVLLYGGENYVTNGGVSPSTAAVIFDPDSNAYGSVPSRGSPPNISRTQHLALLDGSGHVLIVGGVTTNMLKPVNEIEWYDPSTAKVFVVDQESLPRTQAAGAVVQDGGVIVIAGGLDQNAALSDEVNFFKFDNATFARAGATQHLHQARRGAAAMSLADDSSVLVMGGYKDATQFMPEESSEAIKTATNTVEQTTATIGPRGDACAALLQKGNVLAIGGRKVGPVSDGSATLITYDVQKATLTAAAAAPVKVPRYWHTCTTLSDGSVLVSGGMTDDTSVLQDAWIYTPIPGE